MILDAEPARSARTDLSMTSESDAAVEAAKVEAPPMRVAGTPEP